MFKFENGDNVKVVNHVYWTGKTGTVEMIFPAGLIDKDTIYKIKYSDSNNGGMYKDFELELND